MKKKVKHLLLWSLLGIFCLGICTVSAQAATTLKKVAAKYGSQTAAFSADVTGDGKADRITVKPLYTTDSEFADKYRITVNGKTAYTLKGWGDSYEVWYAAQSKNRQFLQIISTVYDDLEANVLLRYENSRKCFTKVLDLGKSSLGTGREITQVTADRIRVKHAYQPALTGYLTWNYYYKYTGGKFVRISNNALAKSGLGQAATGDGYEKYFRKNQFVVQKKMNFYRDAGSSKLAFTASPKNVLTLVRIRLIGGKDLWMQFQKGSASGWIKYTGYGQAKNFYGVEQRLAG